MALGVSFFLLLHVRMETSVYRGSSHSVCMHGLNRCKSYGDCSGLKVWWNHQFVGVYWMGQTQPSTATLKAVMLFAENAFGGSLFHSLMAEGKKGMKVDISSGLRNERLPCWPQEQWFPAVDVLSGGFRSRRPLIILYIKIALLTVLQAVISLPFSLHLSPGSLVPASARDANLYNNNEDF